MMDGASGFETRPVEPIDDWPEALFASFPSAPERPAKRLDDVRGIAEALRELPEKGAEIAGGLRALMYLFAKALDDDSKDGPLTTASYLVIDTIETMAKRLDALNVQARVLYQPVIDAERGRSS